MQASSLIYEYAQTQPIDEDRVALLLCCPGAVHKLPKLPQPSKGSDLEARPIRFVTDLRISRSFIIQQDYFWFPQITVLLRNSVYRDLQYSHKKGTAWAYGRLDFLTYVCCATINPPGYRKKVRPLVHSSFFLLLYLRRRWRVLMANPGLLRFWLIVSQLM